jgi:hypothetical protein
MAAQLRQSEHPGRCPGEREHARIRDVLERRPGQQQAHSGNAQAEARGLRQRLPSGGVDRRLSRHA